MTNSQKFSDEQLTAFLDGEFDHTPAEEIKTAMEHDQLLNERINSLQIDRAGMKEAFSSLNELAPSYEELVEPHIQPPSGWDLGRFSKIAATILVAAGIGFGASNLYKAQNSGDWHSYVASYQALYVTETLAHINQSGPSKLTELARTSATIEKDIDLAILSSNEGLDYKRGQVLSFEGAPLIQLAFLSGDTPVALCIMNAYSDKAYPPEIGKMEQMDSAHWSDGKHSYLIIGAVGKTSIADFAKYFAKAI